MGAAIAKWILLAAASLPAFAQAQDAIGRMLLVRGVVEARAVNGTVRQLARRSEFFEHEAIVVGPEGFASLRLSDDSRISLGPNTEFRFDSYRFASPAAPNAAIMHLVRGCFRAVSGSIGGSFGGEHRVDTAVATIRIRGTFHEAAIDGDVLYTGTLDGATTVTSGAGSLDLGVGGNYDYSRTAAGSAPEGLLGPVAQLQCGQRSVTTGSASTAAPQAQTSSTDASAGP